MPAPTGRMGSRASCSVVAISLTRNAASGGGLSRRNDLFRLGREVRRLCVVLVLELGDSSVWPIRFWTIRLFHSTWVTGCNTRCGGVVAPPRRTGGDDGDEDSRRRAPPHAC